MTMTGPAAPPWADELTPTERAALDPGPAELTPSPDVLVVGGGALGVATAVTCVRSGLGRVLLVERATIASGPSGSAAGLLTPEAHHAIDPPPFVDLARRGLDLWRELHATSPAGIGVVDLDWISLEPHDPPFAADLPSACEQLSADAMSRLIPALARPVAGVRIGQARVNPVLALARLLISAGRELTVATGVAVDGVTVSGDRVVSVSTTHGPVTPGAVVFAVGRSPRLPGLGLDLPSGVVKGHLLLTEPLPTSWPGSVMPVATVVTGGRLLIGGSLDVGDESPDVNPDMVRLMREYVESFMTPLRLPPTSRAWVCFRPTHPDHLAVIDRVPGLANAWVTSGHYRTGIVMAPAVAEVLAGWIASGTKPAHIEPFTTNRVRA